MKPYQDESPKNEQIRSMFDSIAPRYDLLNHLLSLGIDRRWRNAVVKMVRGKASSTLLDLAAGTGDMSVLIARKTDCRIVAADPSEGMLDVAKRKITAKNLTGKITVVTAEAEKLPFADGSFDAVTIAFGIRNFHDIPSSLGEIRRVLKANGSLFILEFSIPRNKIFGAIYRFYFHRVLPFIGGWISKDKKAYKYLPDSVDEFPDKEEFLGIMDQTGFEASCPVSFMTGVARIYTGTKKIKDEEQT